MPVDLNQLAQQDADFAKQAAAARQAEQNQQAQPKAPPTFLQRWTQPVVRATLSTLDDAVASAERLYHESDTEESGMVHQGRNIAAGLAQGVANTGDAVVSFGHAVGKEAETMVSPTARWDREVAQDIGSESDAAAARERWMDQDGSPTSPIWDHARSAIMDFRDAVAVKDPTMADNLVQSVAQLAVPFAGYSRALAGLHGFANVVGAGALTDMTALKPHDMRTADLIALGQHTEGKLGEVLRAMGPYGLNAYVNFLTDRTGETEAEGRFKNALDGLGANMILTPLLHSAGVVLKQGMPALRYLAENAGGGPLPGGMKAQAGGIRVTPPAAPPEPIRVYHGTVHDVDSFDPSKMGSGEGNQSYGHGFYFAENRETAQHYADTQRDHFLRQDPVYRRADESLDQMGGDRRLAVQDLSQQRDRAKNANTRSELQRTIDFLKAQKDLPKGNVYSVDLPGDGKYLDWDNGGKETYRALEKKLGSPQAASENLRGQGYAGIQYLDEGSRGKGKGTSNYVVFDPSQAKIVH